ncbi:MAG TPA: helix-turn-helix domain-containing protein [Chthoniobacterales bacterium]|jgi:transcriptional regulator of acetoin/glycerol metabolism|nr:helix-turn-helix domain-containing protein [Chthoniobacterales bacterium]
MFQKEEGGWEIPSPFALRTKKGMLAQVGVSDEFSQKQREEIVRALTECKGRVSGPHGAAARLGINRNTLVSRMKKFGIDPRQSA